MYCSIGDGDALCPCAYELHARHRLAEQERDGPVRSMENRRFRLRIIRLEVRQQPQAKPPAIEELRTGLFIGVCIKSHFVTHPSRTLLSGVLSPSMTVLLVGYHTAGATTRCPQSDPNIYVPPSALHVNFQKFPFALQVSFLEVETLKATDRPPHSKLLYEYIRAKLFDENYTTLSGLFSHLQVPLKQNREPILEKLLRISRCVQLVRRRCSLQCIGPVYIGSYSAFQTSLLVVHIQVSGDLVRARTSAN
ncbi:hypothetical protein SS50377_25014 [Spironucleus salmonicida]|uniref:Uncharacterized protein n=1 Tax=Spironucleus salmonicida TaxID=348837 RepID=V6LH72_9EUKA|nr:hypothetical protein SS50377_25010 [Spironucleus salmonicida]KAH0572899.1 hypothetical protein SS50377_25014 [Spironucleus salmonicida]|eukprot:EST43066.1 Hypothetical protein SS50377_17223 [Spironucleus salmonicida]